ncbi:MAG: sulfatase [Verrucomicrobiota bacterium]
MKPFTLLFLLCLPFLCPQTTISAPNVLWVYVDDMSDWLGCYGYDAVPTPHIDRLAKSGTRFERAYMPSPVCSTTRSALITGTMQTSHGLHHHRTTLKEPLPDGIQTIPERFREAGYLTFNESKEDYNFTYDRDHLFSPEFDRPGIKGHLAGRNLSWLEQLKGKPFFGQIQLKGGKFEGETGSKYPAHSRVKEADVTVPPYYPDNPVIRNAIARHYEQIVETDQQVGAIMAALDEFGLSENTVVFFFTDHGCPLPRSKQFLYEDGTKVPLIVAGPGIPADAVRTDLVSGIDIPSTSLALANIPAPGYIEGHDLFAEKSPKRDHVISARDRCGIATDRIRAVRTDRFRYIRNYQTDRALYQPQYRDKFATFVLLHDLYEEGKLDALPASYHDPAQRPAEELYDLKNDPDQTVNLAGDPEYATQIEEHRKLLESWEQASDDKGRYPESEAKLKAVADQYGAERCVAPEFSFLVKQNNQPKSRIREN